MSADDRNYYQRRAEEEVERARCSTDPRIVEVHYRLTELYLDKVHGSGAPAAQARR
jgi:hypothetical protein